MIVIIFFTKTYSEAQKLVSELEYKPYVYSTENESSAIKKADEDREFFKNRTVPKHFATKILNNVCNDLNGNFDSNIGIDNLLSKSGSSSKDYKKKDKESMKRKRSFKKLHKSKLSRTSSGSDKSSDDTSIDENKKRRKPANLKNKQSKSADGKTQKRASSSSDSISLDENIRTRKPKNSKNRSPGSQERKTKKTTRISISSSGENDTGFFKSSTSDNIKNNKLEDNNKCENSCCIHEKTLKSLEFKIDTVISNYHSLSKQIGTQNSLIIDLKNSFQAQNMSQYYIMSDGEESNPNVKLPCQTKEIFDQLEEALKDKDYNSKMIRKFLRMMNKELPIVKNTSAMIKHCLSRDLALQFNLLKPNDKKK